MKCPKCGITLSEEMIEANLCWECGKILDETLLENNTLEEIKKQANEQCFISQGDFEVHKKTTGHSFEGYEIIEYLGVVSGEKVFGTGVFSDIKASFSDLFGMESDTYSEKMKSIKEAALYDMVRESIKRGGNAIIGISFTYVTFAGSNMIGISVDGTSVIIKEKVKS